MRRPQITRIQSGHIDINAPAAQTHRIYEDIHLIRQQRIHHHHVDAEHIHHGEPTPLQIDIDPTQVRYQISGPHIEREYSGRQPNIEQQRGDLRSVDQRPEPQKRGWFSSPPPRQQPAALPAPSQQQRRGELRPTDQPQEHGRRPQLAALPAPQQQPAQQARYQLPPPSSAQGRAPALPAPSEQPMQLTDQRPANQGLFGSLFSPRQKVKR